MTSLKHEWDVRFQQEKIEALVKEINSKTVELRKERAVLAALSTPEEISIYNKYLNVRNTLNIRINELFNRL